VCEIREYLGPKLRTGACAARLVYEMAGHWCRMPQSFGGEPVLLNVHGIIDQIGEMERALNIPPATSFGVGPLRGIWHTGLRRQWLMAEGSLPDVQKSRESFIIQRLIARYTQLGWHSRTIDRGMVGLLAHASVLDGLAHADEKTNRGARPGLADQWIVFAKASGRNIYLTLCGHDESREAILERCLPAAREFNELAAIRPFRKLHKDRV